MATTNLASIKEAILKGQDLGDNAAETLKKMLYEDDVIDREEADFLFEINDLTAHLDADDHWNHLFVNAITDHVTEAKDGKCNVTEEGAKYLMGKLKKEDAIFDNEKILLKNVLDKADLATKEFKSFAEGLLA